MADIPLRVASVNLLHGLDVATGSVDMAATAAGVAGLAADVVALQEVDRAQPRSGEVDQAAVVAAVMGGEHRFAAALAGDPDRRWVPAGGRDVDGPAYGIALVSRWPIVDAVTVALPGGAAAARATAPAPGRPGYDREPRVALRAILDLAGRRTTVTVVHLSYLPWRGGAQLRVAAAAAVPPPADDPAAGLDVPTDGGAGDTRDAGYAPALLTGDFNLPVWAVRALARGWRHGGGAPTFPSWRPRAQPDQLLARGRVAIDAAWAGPRLTSDHLPLLAQLRVT